MAIDKKYDIVIVGAGPTGLALAHCLSSLTGTNGANGTSETKVKKILVIEREKTIGGCHRVIRDRDGLFTEHGPRIYLSTYKTLFFLMKDMGLEIDDIFVLYKYSIIELVLQNVFPNITFSEVVILIADFLKFMYDDRYGENVNYKKHLKDQLFSDKMIEILDRTFRFLDGGDLSKYSLNKVQSIFNVSTLVTIYQPKKPNDEGLFPYWKAFLEKRGVEFMLDTNIEKINYRDGKIVSVNAKNANSDVIHLDKLILAVPPSSMSKILDGNDVNVRNCFGNFKAFEKWSEKTEYIEYICITYHFILEIEFAKISGATMDTDWGIICINLSDYMKNPEKNYKRLLSLAITITDRKSKRINKTANECTAEELFDEVYRQIKKSIYPNLPGKEEYKAIMNPNNYYKDGKWNSKDEAFFNTFGTKYLKNKSDTIPNIYNAGSQNGHDLMHYTTMESAVSNGITLATELFPELKEKYKIHPFLTTIDYIFYLFIAIIILILIILLIRNI
jgi:hypothetical protein